MPRIFAPSWIVARYKNKMFSVFFPTKATALSGFTSLFCKKETVWFTFSATCAQLKISPCAVRKAIL